MGGISKYLLIFDCLFHLSGKLLAKQDGSSVCGLNLLKVLFIEKQSAGFPSGETEFLGKQSASLEKLPAPEWGLESLAPGAQSARQMST